MRSFLPFQHPAGLWLLAALVPLVILYVLKVRRARHVVGSTWLWAAARRDVLARSPFQKLVARVPLFLQALALILLAVALATPVTRHRALLGDHVALVIDVSASMGAFDAAPRRRIDEAKQAALDALGALTPGAEAMVITAGREPRVVAPLDHDVRRLGDAVDALTAEDVEGDMGAAVALAVDRLRPLGGARRVVVFTDGNVTDPEVLTAGAALPLDVVTVGAPVANVGVVRVDVRAGVDPVTKEEEVQGFALVANYGPAPRDVFVTLRMAAAPEPLASRRLTLAPGERAPVVLTFRPAPGDRGQGLVFDVAPHDEMPADDVAYARVPEGQRQPVLLVSDGGSPWLDRALASDPHVELWRGTSAELANAPSREGALYVYAGPCPTDFPPGDLLVVGPPPGPCLGLTVGDEVTRPAVTSWSPTDMRLRFLTLDGVAVERARALVVDGPRDTLVRAQTGTLVADVSAAGRSGTVVGFDVGESNWPLKASFVLFMRNVVELAREHRANGAVGSTRAGEALRLPVPHDVTEVRVRAPGERDEGHVVAARAGLAVVGTTGRAGLHFVSWQGARPGSILVPVNLTSERESDLRARTAVGTVVTGVGPALAGVTTVTDAPTDWTFAVAACALAFVLFDAFWVTRKPSRRAALPRELRGRP